MPAQLGWRGLNKKPAIALAIAGFSKSKWFSLEVPSHDAVVASKAMPHGRQSRDSLVANANFNRGDHLLARNSKTHQSLFVKPIVAIIEVKRHRNWNEIGLVSGLG